MTPETKKYLSTTLEKFLLVLVGMSLIMLAILATSCSARVYPVKDYSPWWMDCPNKGGFDCSVINDAIKKGQQILKS